MSKESFKDGQLRYISRGVSEHIPKEIQSYLWKMVDILRETTKPDYLQVFRLETIGNSEDGTLVQVITHSQERPNYERTYYFPMDEKGVTEKIYIIDSVEYATMILASEY